MSISLVQSQPVVNPSTAAASFASPTTAGNCVVVLLYTWASTSVTISTSAATLGGAADNFAQAAAVQSGLAGGASDYIGCWVDPNCAGGKTAVAATVANGTWSTDSGIILLEFSGVAASNAVDTGVTSTGSGTSGTALSSGSLGTTAVANEMAVGAAYPDNGLSSEDGSYTNIVLGTSFLIGSAGYKTVASPGSTVSYTATAPSGAWAALVIALKPAAAFLPVPPKVISQAVSRASTY